MKLKLLLELIVTTLVLGLMPPAWSQSDAEAGWVASWTAGPQQQVGDLVPLEDRTIRAYVPLGVGGEQIMIRFSNEYGSEALNIGAATVGLLEPDGSIRAGSLHKVTFGGAASLLVPVGAPAYSDPVALAVPDAAVLAISLHLPGPVLPETYNRRSAGAQTADGRPSGAVVAAGNATDTLQLVDAEASDFLFLTRVDVLQPQVSKVIAVLGTSRTNGPGHWPEYLGSRLNSAGPSVSVINASLQANVLTWPYPGGGDAALARFDRDILIVPGITHVVIADAINDIGQPGTAVIPASRLPSVETLGAAYQQFVTRARARGVKVIAATVMPFEGVPFEGFYAPNKDVLRRQLNEWIRNNDIFDGIIDLDAMMRDPQNPSRFRPGLHTDNNFGPNAAGEQMIAEAINIELFR